MEEKVQILPGCAQAFIEQVIRKMGYRRKIRLEVRRELTDHFLDVLADVEDAADRDRIAAEHVAAFGDAAILGRLLRRAKKRCRPWWRTAMVRLFQTAAAMVGLFILYLAWFFSGRPVITTNYIEQFNGMVKPAVNADLNADPFYRKAFEAYVKSDEHIAPGPTSMSSLEPDEKESIRRWLEDNESALESAMAGSRQPHYWPVYKASGDTTEMLAVLLPHLSDHRNIAWAMLWKGRMAAAEGNTDEAIEWSSAAWRLGRHLTGDRTLIEQLVAFAIASGTAQSVRQALAENEFDDYVLRRMQEAFAGQIAEDSFIVSFEGEKMFMYDEIQRSFTTRRIGKSHLYIRRMGHIAPLLGNTEQTAWPKMALRILFTHPSKEETLKSVEEFYASMDRLRMLAPHQQKSAPPQDAARIEELKRHNLFLDLLAPALEKVVVIGYRVKADAEAMLTVIGLLRYERQNGQFPGSLHAAKEAGCLAFVPMDPYTDEPLIYRRTDTGFTLYSTGANGVDNGGKVEFTDRGNLRFWAEQDGDTVFWPVYSTPFRLPL